VRDCCVGLGEVFRNYVWRDHWLMVWVGMTCRERMHRVVLALRGNGSRMGHWETGRAGAVIDLLDVIGGALGDVSTSASLAEPRFQSALAHLSRDAHDGRQEAQFFRIILSCLVPFLVLHHSFGSQT
jgi:hypothetical protein